MAPNQKSAGQIRSESGSRGQDFAESEPSILGMGTVASRSSAVGAGPVSDAVAEILGRIAIPKSDPCVDSDSTA